MAASNTTLIQDMSHTFDGVVDTEGNVNTDRLCEAVRSLVKMLEHFGLAFKFVASDLAGNCTKVETYRKANNTDATTTISGLVASELAKNQASTTQGLVWLTRGLRFLTVALSDLVAPSVEPSDAFTDSYQTTLRPHHGMVIRLAVNTAFKAVQSREGFIDTIAKSNPDLRPVVMDQLATWLNPLGDVTQRLTVLLYSVKSVPAVKKVETIRDEEAQFTITKLPTATGRAQ